jgi:4-amino-4-deoxy-L-arabinose transferase-like glycosyltransferase
VRRWFGPGAGLLAGGILALTPVAALMFRFNNPDALLVLLLTGATYAALRALEGGRTGWIVLSASLIGTAFLTKMLQAFLIVPILLGVYLLAGPPRLGRRLWQLALGGAALVVASGW